MKYLLTFLFIFSTQVFAEDIPSFEEYQALQALKEETALQEAQQELALTTEIANQAQLINEANNEDFNLEELAEVDSLSEEDFATEEVIIAPEASIAETETDLFDELSSDAFAEFEPEEVVEEAASEDVSMDALFGDAADAFEEFQAGGMCTCGCGGSGGAEGSVCK